MRWITDYLCVVVWKLFYDTLYVHWGLISPSQKDNLQDKILKIEENNSFDNFVKFEPNFCLKV